MYMACTYLVVACTVQGRVGSGPLKGRVRTKRTSSRLMMGYKLSFMIFFYITILYYIISYHILYNYIVVYYIIAIF